MVQIYIEDVIFPDDVDFDRRAMHLRMTYKFDTTQSAHSAVWLMPLMKYHNAQLRSMNRHSFEALAASRLAIKQDTAGAAYAFSINAADHDHLRTVQKTCFPD